MSRVNRLENVSQFNEQRGQKTLHPLVSVLDQSKSQLIQGALYTSDLYIIFLKESKSGQMKYGRNRYDYQDGTMLFIAPGQVFGFDENEGLLQPTGWALVFHPDLLRGSSLGSHMKEYSFFSYDQNEALHLSDDEKQLVVESFQKILMELSRSIDKHTKRLIVSNIELLLNYCIRFYDRQFITRDSVNSDLLVQFEKLLDTFFESDKPQVVGLPSVSYCAGELHLSSNYFGDLIKKETGRSAHEYIQDRIIEIAKQKVIDTGKSISEIAYEIGFKYPTHFTRLFKQKVGQSPLEFRLSNN